MPDPPKKVIKNANKNEYSDRIRRAEQCWLIANSDIVVKDNPSGGGFAAPAFWYGHSFNTHHISMDYVSKFEEILGKFFIGPEIATLFDLKTSEISGLLPRLDLYRVDIDPKTGKVVNTLPFHFASHVSKTNVADLISGKTDRFGEAGIMGVNWELLGGQPAEVKRYVQVDIEFFFSTISILTRDGKNLPKNRLSYLDLFRRRGNSATEPPYKLRLDVGWHLPDENSAIFKGDKKRAQAVRKALSRSNKTMWLQLRNHDLKFNQDGTVNLTIQYFSSLEYDLQKINVIKDNKNKGSQKKWKKELKKAEGIYKQFKDAKCKPSNTHKGPDWLGTRWNQTQEYTDWLRDQKKMKMRLEFAQKSINQNSFSILKNINDYLKAKIPESTKLKGGKWARSRIFQVTVPAVELGFADGNIMLEDGWFTNTYGGKNIKVQVEGYGDMRARRGYKITPISIYSAFTQGKVGARLKKVSKIAKGVKLSSKDMKEYKKQINLMEKELVATVDKKKNTTIQYCFLGDIIDAALEACKMVYGRSDPHLNSILSNMKIVFGILTIPTFQGQTGKATKRRKIPLNDLPVSYNLFNAWFIKTVINSGRKTILLKDFIRLLLTQLVNAAMGNNCFADQHEAFKNFPPNRVDLGFYTLRIPNSNDKPEELFTKSRADESLAKVPIFEKRLTVAQSEALKFSEAEPEDDNVTLTNYFFINAVNSDMMKVRKQDRIRDMKSGVFHLNIAQDDGIVRDISFSKVNADYLEEALLETSKTKRKLEIFRRIYNVDIESYGNASFLPGQLFYVDPTTVGLGSPSDKTSTARALGLGGYYVVVKVSSSVSRGQFYTKFSGRWVGFGDGETVFKTAASANAAAKKKGCDREKLVEEWQTLPEALKF